MRQLDPQHGGLQRVQAEVAADALMDVLGLGAVIAQEPDLARQLLVARRDQPAVAEGAEILARKEREAADRAHRSCLPAVIPRADGLRGILDHRDPGVARSVQDRIHVRALAIQVHDDDGSGLGGDRGADGVGGEVVCRGIDVHQPRRGAQPADAPGGREERVSRREDVVAGADAERHHRGEESVGAGRDRDRVASFELADEIAFERVDFGTEDEPLAVADPRQGREDLVADRRVLRLEIQQRHTGRRLRRHRMTISGAPQSGSSLSMLPGTFGGLA